MYPRCKHCLNRYANGTFLVLHMRRRHFQEYVLFLQQRWRYIKNLQYKKALHIIRGCVVRLLFLRKRKACNVIKKRFLEYTYKPYNPGYYRTVYNWNKSKKIVKCLI